MDTMIAEAKYFGILPHWMVGLCIIIWVVGFIRAKLDKEKEEE